MRPGFSRSTSKAVVHGAVNRQQGLSGDTVRVIFCSCSICHWAIHQVWRSCPHTPVEILVSKRGLIRTLCCCGATRIQSSAADPLPAEDVQKQIGTALAAANGAVARLPAKSGVRAHHLAGMEAAVILCGHAVREVDLFTNPHADVAREEADRAGLLPQTGPFLIKTHLLHLLAEGEVVVRFSAAQLR